MSKKILLVIPDDLSARLDAHVERIHGVRTKAILGALEEYLDRQEAIFGKLEEMHRSKNRK